MNSIVRNEDNNAGDDSSEEKDIVFEAKAHGFADFISNTQYINLSTKLSMEVEANIVEE
jgi:hypothetical protein